MTRPTGTITFMFTDIEGSTRRWEADPEAMRAALADHDEVLRSAISAHDGWMFKHTGDGVCAAFFTAPEALAAAVEAQSNLRLPVRIALATGTAQLRDDDYFGPALNRAARVMSVAHGRQILLAESSAALVAPEAVRSLGTFKLRDLAGSHELFQAMADNLPQHFPGPRAERTSMGNLPTVATALIGRDEAVAEIGRLLAERRLVTLTGVGGVGKTRLALAAAAALEESFPGGTWWVELAPLADDNAMPEVVAAALGVGPKPGLSTTQSIAAMLGERSSLLVLDNCEHLLDGAASLVEALQRDAPTLQVLATSREGLSVPGEFLWVVPSLPSGSRHSPAVALFADRARAAGASVDLDDPSELNAVVELCGRLDGIALAIELAAARTVMLSPQELCTRLDDRFRLLTGPRRRLERHQTLRHAVQWSVDLLSPDDAEVLARCSVFAGGFDLAAATAVCGQEGTDEFEMLECLQSLVGKSLLRSERMAGRNQFTLLETIRQYGAELLADRGEVAEIHRRHAAWYASLVEREFARWSGPEQAQAVDVLLTNAANLRQAVSWLSEAGDLNAAASIAAHATMAGWAVQWFEPATWAEELLHLADIERVPRYPRLLCAVGQICCYTGRPTEALDFITQALRCSAADGFDPFGAIARANEATAHVAVGDVAGWVTVCESLSRGDGEERVIGLAGLLWGLPAVGRAAEARQLAAEANRISAAFGHPWWVAMTKLGAGRAYSEVEPHTARSALTEGLEYCGRHRLAMWAGIIARELAGLESNQGNHAEALARADHAIDAFESGDDPTNLSACWAVFGVVLQRLGRLDDAAVAFGMPGTEVTLELSIGAPQSRATVMQSLGQERFQAATQRGAGMNVRAAVDWARTLIAELLNSDKPAA